MSTPAHRIALPALCAAVAIALSPGPARASVLYLAPDTPADLGATTFTASDIVSAQQDVYALQLALPPSARIDALARLSTGEWLISLESATVLGGTNYDPRDVIRTDGVTFALFWGGAANGVPAGVNVDGLSLQGSDTGPLLLSVDVPATFGTLDVDPGDVVRWTAGVYTIAFDASAATPPVPARTNVVGVDWLQSGILLSFDVPTTLGSRTFVPGDVVQWNAGRYTLFREAEPAGWGMQHEVAGMTTPPSAGTSGDLRVTRAGANSLELTWRASCSTWASDYGIYVGMIGNFTSHTAADCTDDGHNLRETIAMPAGNRYFLMVPLTTGSEGSYGTDSAGNERPRGTAACRATQGPSACP